MSLQPGTKLGPYEVVAALGAGGMGEVYRAKDARLGREVAIKVLPPHLSENAESRARFEREARTISSLNHPNICTLYDVGREGSTEFLVMELVEGPTLADRLARGPLPAEDALRIGIEVSDALERAHRAGIIHRDLKPGNIMLAKSGAKLMDFGLARAAEVAAAPGSGTQSPTLTRPLTAEGSIVGTFQYMAPEQLDGGEADARADIWALGATLYEMVTGQKAFTGRSQASLIASILKEQPAPVSSVQPLAPPALDQVIRGCLAKDPEQRIQTAHDVKLQLQWIAEGGSRAGVAAPVAARRRSREGLAWSLAGVGLAATIAFGVLWILRRPEPPRVLRFEVMAPPGTTSMGWPRLSPDGRMLAFLCADSAGVQRIWVRPLDALEARVMPGTEGAGRPFWSPDSRFLAYISEGKLRKIALEGGPPTALADTPGRYDGTWGSSGWIVMDGAIGDSLGAVRAEGGTMRWEQRLDRAAGDLTLAWPSMLPDGKHYLYLATRGRVQEIRLAEIGSTRTVKLGESDGRAEYASGHLLFSRDETLLAQPFDPRTLKTTGEPVPVGENILTTNSGQFSVSAAGMLAFRSMQSRPQSQLTWFDRSGRKLGTVGPPGSYRDIALSPKNDRVAVCILDPQKGTEDVWVHQFARGTTTRLTFDAGTEISPVWSPDGEQLAYAADRSGPFRPYFQRADGTGSVDSVKKVFDMNGGPSDWSATAGLILRYVSGTSGWDLWRVAMPAAMDPVTIVATPNTDLWGVVSPDGRWFAFQSLQSGRSEVYVQPTDGSGGKWQISTAGGGYPAWRADGRELFYETSDRSIVSVSIAAGPGFEAGAPVTLFKSDWVTLGYAARRWDVSADGQRFLINVPQQTAERARFTVITNWASELKRR